jgi:HEPN domain-containing protein
LRKWLKAVMALKGLEKARIHDLSRLLEILGRAGLDPPRVLIGSMTCRSMQFRFATRIS